MNVVWEIIGVAIIALVAWLTGRRGAGRDRADKATQAELDRRLSNIDRRRVEREEDADAELEAKRSGSVADRLAGAIARARRRRNSGN